MGHAVPAPATSGSINMRPGLASGREKFSRCVFARQVPRKFR